MRMRCGITGIIMWILAAFVATVIFSGCGLLNGPSDYKNYSDALSAHAASESARIGTQSQAIVNSLLTANPKTDTERSLMAVIGMMEISRLTPTTLNIIKPTTGYDVLDHNISPIFGTVLTGALGYWSYGAIKALGNHPGNIFNLKKGDLNATGSFNPTTTTVHQTYSSGGTIRMVPAKKAPEITAPVIAPTIPTTTPEAK